MYGLEVQFTTTHVIRSSNPLWMYCCFRQYNNSSHPGMLQSSLTEQAPTLHDCMLSLWKLLHVHLIVVCHGQNSGVELKDWACAYQRSTWLHTIILWVLAFFFLTTPCSDNDMDLGMARHTPLLYKHQGWWRAAEVRELRLVCNRVLLVVLDYDPTTIASWRYAHPPFLLKVIAKGHLLLESMPTQQTKITCSSMHSDEIRSVHVCVG